MDQTPAEPRLRRAVRAVILSDDGSVLLCRFRPPHPAVSPRNLAGPLATLVAGHVPGTSVPLGL